MSERKREEIRDEEGLPPPRHVTALAIQPDLLQRLIDEYFAGKPVEMPAEVAVPEIAKDLIDAIHEVRSVIMRSLLRQIPQSVVSISSKKTFVESCKQLAISILTVLDALGEGYISDLQKGLDAMMSATASRTERVEAMRNVYKTSLKLLAVIYAVPIVIKDLTGILELNLPFHLASDYVKKIVGYTATQ